MKDKTGNFVYFFENTNFAKKKIQNKVTKEDIYNADRKVRRETELENATGFISTHKIHKSEKDYNRKDNKRG